MIYSLRWIKQFAMKYCVVSLLVSWGLLFLDFNNIVYFFYMLCFLNKSSLVKNFYLSSVLPVNPVTYIVTNVTFFVKILIARHETRNFKLPWDIFGDYANVMIQCWSEHQNQPCWACQSNVRHAKLNWLHDRHAWHAKLDKQRLGMKHQPSERSGT